jgi:hypothetical protein
MRPGIFRSASLICSSRSEVEMQYPVPYFSLKSIVVDRAETRAVATLAI